MSFTSAAIRVAERLPIPDRMTLAGIDYLVGRTNQHLGASGSAGEREFARGMAEFPIAQHTDAANAQHYEVPSAFFGLVLGPHRKYSCCYYEARTTSLGEAEARALAETAAHADIANGQRILELGCGWGSLSLWLAGHFPGAEITAVSNSNSQRVYIEAEAAKRGYDNLTVITADMNDFQPASRFDRIVSVEMFEHMANWRALLERARGWLQPDGRLFLHVFTHKSAPYRFDHRDPADWIAQYFFTGGIMPSHGLIRQFDDLFAVDAEWRWSGAHYARTAQDWLKNFDRNAEEIDAILRHVYGKDAALWRRRWRLFFLATEGLFAHRGGGEWGVSHYRLRPTG